MARHRLTDYAPLDRPRERLAESGPQALSNAELLAILLRTGVSGENAVQVAQRLLGELGDLPGLHRASLSDLCAVRGVGLAKGAQLQAAVELGRRVARAEAGQRPLVQSPADAAALVQYEMSGLDQEHLWVLILDTRHRLLKTARVYHGSLNTSLVRVGEIFREAVKLNAAAIVVVHNHPSGDPTPSSDDVAVTRAIAEAGRLLDIHVLDHLVVGRSKYVSMKEKGLL